MKLTYDKSKVFWEYKEKKYEYAIDNICRVALKNNYILIQSNNKERTEDIDTYITLEGLLVVIQIFRNANDISLIVINEDNKRVGLEIPFIQSMIEISTNYLYIIAGECGKTKLLIYSLYGKKIKEYFPPDNYNLVRFFDSSTDEKEIKVVCYGEPDKYYRSEWSFSLNLETGEWKKLSFAY
jgi:hypothetical protein